MYLCFPDHTQITNDLETDHRTTSPEKAEASFQFGPVAAWANTLGLNWNLQN